MSVFLFPTTKDGCCFQPDGSQSLFVDVIFLPAILQCPHSIHHSYKIIIIIIILFI